MSAKIQKVTQSVDKMRKSVGNASSAMAKMSAIASSTATKISKDFKKAYQDAKPDNLFDGMDTLGKKVTAVGLAGAGALGFAVKTAADFEAAMSQVSAISGATGDTLDRMSKAAREAGAKTTKTAKEAADALMYMSLAGWDAETSMAGLMPILRLSEAGNLELGRTSDLVTDSMASLGLTVQDLPRYLDHVAQSSRKSNTEIDQMLEAMMIVGGTFNNLNTPLEEASALLGILANRGTKGTEAGTALNSIIVNLTSGMGMAGKAMKELNIDPFDKTTGKFKGLEVVLKELKEKTAGLTEEQRNLYLAQIGGKTQLDTLQKLLAGVGNEYDSLRDSVYDSNGVLEDMAITMQDNFYGSLNMLKSAIEEAAISVGNVFKGSLRNAAAALNKLVDRFNALPESSKRTIAVIMAATTAFALIGGPLLILIALLPSIAAGFAMIGTVALPVGIATLAIGALVAAGLYLRKNWGNIKKRADELKTKLIDLKTKSIDKVKDGITAVKDKFKEWQPVIENTAKILGVIFGPALIKTGIEAVTAGGRIALNFIGSLARAGTAAVINAAKITSRFIVSLIRAGVQASATALVITGKFIVSLVRAGVQAAATALIITGQLVGAMLRYALSGWRVVASIAAVSLAWVAQKAVLIASTLLTWGMVAAQWALNAAMWAAPYMWIVAAILAVVAVGVLLYKNWDTIKAKAGELWASLTEKFSGIKEGVVSSINGAKEGFLSALRGMKSGAVSIVNGIINAFNGMISNLNGLSFTVPDWVPGKMAGKKFGLNLNPIPNIDGSHYHGIDYVPHNGYIAELHRGERVQTAQEAKEARQTGGGGVTYQFGDIHLHGVGGDLEKAADQLMGIIVRRAYEAREAGA